MLIDVSNKIGKHRFKQEITSKELIRQMDQAGVDIAVVSSYAESLDNESVLNAVKEFPDRFIGLYTVNPWNENAASEFELALSQGFKGLYMNPVRHGYILSEHSVFYPLLDICRKHSVPVWVYSLAEVYCCPVFLDEIAEEYSNVNFIMGGMGVNYDNASAIKVAKKHSNIYLESSRAVKMNIVRALQEVGPDRLMIGTGTPEVNFFELEIKKMERALKDYPSCVKEAVFYKTAAKLFNVEVEI